MEDILKRYDKFTKTLLTVLMLFGIAAAGAATRLVTEPIGWVVWGVCSLLLTNILVETALRCISKWCDDEAKRQNETQERERSNAHAQMRTALHWPFDGMSGGGPKR